MVKINQIINHQRRRLKYWGVTANFQLMFYDIDTKQELFTPNRLNGLQYEELDF